MMLKIDQAIYRYAKLQDAMGSRLYKGILDYLGEDTDSMAFKDILLKLEKLGVISSANEWFELQ